MKTALITGANGFIGKALTKKLLDEGMKVYAIVRNRNNIKDVENKNLFVIELDADKYNDINLYINEKIDVFYHLVWEGGMNGEKFKDYELQLKNAIYSCKSLDGAIKLNSKKFILVSTINEIEVVSYFNKYDIRPRYTCIYSSSKFASNIICKTMAYQNNIDINIALLANSYGEGDTSNTLPNVLFRHFIEGKSPRLVEGNFYYDLVHIDEIVDALYLIFTKGVNQKDYYIGHRKLKLFKELVEYIKNIINPSIELKFGEFKDESTLDYSKIDIDSLYNDTGFDISDDMSKNIIKTAQWIIENKIGE